MTFCDLYLYCPKKMKATGFACTGAKSLTPVLGKVLQQVEHKAKQTAFPVHYLCGVEALSITESIRGHYACLSYCCV